MPQIMQLPVGPLQTNCYVLACMETQQAAVIDPGWNGRAIADMVAEKGWTVTHILLTHAHFDHIGGLTELKDATAAPIYAHADAIPMLENAENAASRFGLSVAKPPLPDTLLNGGDVVTVGNLQLDVLFTPGHAPGHVCFYLAEQNVLFDGDVLFQGSIGRTDLPGGDYALLMQSIHDKVLPLPDETQVLSGHGPVTTVGQERERNPFLQGL